MGRPAQKRSTTQKLLKGSRAPRVHIPYEVVDAQNVAVLVSLVGAAVGVATAGAKALEVWVSQQEAYSVAMAFTEFAEDHGSQVGLQIFATDLNAAGVDTARAGIYPKDIAHDVSPERLRRFFVEVDGHYRIAKWSNGTAARSRP